jgi:HAD superfamily hydrolase (TIGR01450 family)
VAHGVNSNLIFDLDGVVYLGDHAVPGAGETLDRLDRAGHHIVFCTNNSSRTRAQSADKIRRVTGYRATSQQIASSAMSAGRLIGGSARVLRVGGDGVAEAIHLQGASEVQDVDADTVVVGIDFSFGYDLLDRASAAVRNGAHFIATNRDVTYPSPERLRPGAGSIVAAVEAASGVVPVNAGKPELPMRELLREMLVDGPVVMIGDRPDTDLAMAHAEGWRSILVDTGVTPPDAEVDPPPTDRVSSIAAVPDLLD